MPTGWTTDIRVRIHQSPALIHPRPYHQVAWHILGPNSREPLPPLNEDFLEPVNGSFYLGDGEEGEVHTIQLSLLPHGEVEVEEVFTVQLSVLSGDVDVDPEAGSVQLQVGPG